MKIKFGSFIVAGSGKIGGHVASKNRGGSYLRTKVTPNNPQTVAQMSVRGIFASISSLWSGLTQGQRDSFDGFVAAYSTTDIFGDIRNPSGKNLFQRLNQNLENTGQSQITTCVAPSEVPFANLTSVEGDTTDNEMFVNTTGDTTGSELLVFATPSLSQGTKFVKNKLRVVGHYAGDNAQSIDIWGDYLAKYGEPVAGANIYVGVRVINTNGQASPLETVKASIIAG
jgi:hypothetical protein